MPESVDGWVPLDLTWNQILGVDWEADARNPVNPQQVTGVAIGFSTLLDSPNSGTIWIDNLERWSHSDLQAQPPSEASEPDPPESEASSPVAGQPSESEPEAPGLCPVSMALGALATAGLFQIRRKKSLP